MKTRKPESSEKGGVLGKTLKSLVLSAALLGVLGGSPEAGAKTVSSKDDGEKVTEVTQPGTEVEEKKDTISLQKVLEMMEKEGVEVEEEAGPKVEPDPDPDPEKTNEIELGSQGEDEPEVKSDDEGSSEGAVIQSDLEGDDEGESKGKIESKESRIGVHGFVQVGTSVVPDFAGIFSDKLSGMIAIDTQDQKTGVGLTVIRLDDFHTDPEYPLSRASVVVPYRTILSKDSKRSAGGSVEFSYIDQMPDKIGCTPVIVGSYSAGGWTFEGKYFHDIREGEDMDAVRLGITKKIGEKLRLTAQGWYKSDYKGKVFGRVIADVDLGGGLRMQISGIARDGKITPTMCVGYNF